MADNKVQTMPGKWLAIFALEQGQGASVECPVEWDKCNPLEVRKKIDEKFLQAPDSEEPFYVLPDGTGGIVDFMLDRVVAVRIADRREVAMQQARMQQAQGGRIIS